MLPCQALEDWRVIEELVEDGKEAFEEVRI